MTEVRTKYIPPTPHFDAKIIASDDNGNQVITHYSDQMDMEQNHAFALKQFALKYNKKIAYPYFSDATYLKCIVSWRVG